MEEKKMTKDYYSASRRYDDIINRSHHISETHPQMSIMNRAAQFSPFAALVGYEDALEEISRHTDAKMALEEDAKEIQDENCG